MNIASFPSLFPSFACMVHVVLDSGHCRTKSSGHVTFPSIQHPPSLPVTPMYNPCRDILYIHFNALIQLDTWQSGKLS
ncbi:hypothetical protein P153DRAFT_369365 [Dothidotthia symphoricarpi CBS 119687]|uniref:Uncharacterized protein n=1 Tax=Dothidotthia symphoricarpi CBS 119687 TaxID=1392245 RepID=A0A6A6A4E1_9PLEO|nr:uncharacterized protein P153DRAFT_369365 [Dothidotthia symphoricarpi CBS 119687]KAF2125984.1 hypothetical protein P153DRAFT_369365 [Dothidotthia symphoricarpi CBS 119687]